MAHRETIANHAFSIEVAEDVLTDLKERVERTRWPNAPSARPWAYGMERDYLRALLDHWRDVYDWRAEEARLNALSHYRVPVGDHQLHVIVEPGSGPSPAPLLLLNGWPSSFVELAGAIAPLAHPERFGGRAEDGFTVI